MTPRHVPEMAPLDPGYVDLLDRVLASAEPDERIRALWVGGSIARGVADAGSDLAVIVTVRDDARRAFDAGWRSWLESCTPVLLAQPLRAMPGSFAATTPDCLRLDVVVESARELGSTPYRTRLCVFDRDGLEARLPAADPVPEPDPDRILSLVEEFYRQQAIFPAAVVAREDWLLGVVAVHTMQVSLFQLFVACNEPLPPMGLKQWSAKLTLEQHDVLTGLRQPVANRENVISSMHDARRAFRTVGRDAAYTAGVEWPGEIDAAVAHYWQRVGVTND